MSAHDPLCPFSVTQQSGCKCYWIALARADALEKVLKGVIGIADHLERRATTVPVTAGALLLHQADGVELVISYLRGEQP